jgi:phage-related baseplate assembly protein
MQADPKQRLKSLPDFDLFLDKKTGFKDVLDGILGELAKAFPGYIAEKDDPLYQLACSFAYREILLRKRINDIALNYCLKLEEANREKFTPFGFKTYYIQKARSCDGVKDATVEGSPGGGVCVYIMIDWSMFTGKEDEKQQFIESVRSKTQAILSSDDVRMVCDHVMVGVIHDVPLKMKALVKVESGSQVIMSVLKDRVLKDFTSENKPGVQKSMSWFVSKIHGPDISEVLILEPKNIPKIGAGQMLRLDHLELSFV